MDWYFEDAVSAPPPATTGSWLVAQRALAAHYKLARPAEIVHISDHGKWRIVWLRRAKVLRTPRVSDLPGGLPEWIVNGEGNKKVLRGRMLASVLELYGPPVATD